MFMNAAPLAPASGSPIALLAGALNHLLQYSLNGCTQSARHAAYLLERLSVQDNVDTELRTLCMHMSELIEDNPVLQTAASESASHFISFKAS
jgi:hypothetical protein